MSEAARSVQQPVPADNGGSSCPPAVGQRPVPADTCDLRARYAAARCNRVEVARIIRHLKSVFESLVEEEVNLLDAIEASKTHVGGNCE